MLSTRFSAHSGPIDRRVLLAAAAATAALRAAPALARAPLAGRQVPGIYRFKVGDLEVTALIDGLLDLPLALFPAASEGEAASLLARAALPAGPAINAPVNAYLVNSGERLVLVDAGTAATMGPTLGQLPASLAAAGVTPDQVDVVLITHLHPDHANGLVTADGRAFFPNAEVVVSDVEHAFWHDDGIMNQAPAEVQAFFRMARAALAPYAAGGRVRRIAGGAEALPGIAALAAPGHTPGHTVYRVASGGDQLLIWGDIVHAAPLQFARPDWSIAFDTDQAAAAATRRRVFDMVAADRLLVAGMHLPFPGIGHVLKEGEAYRFAPAPWRSLG